MKTLRILIIAALVSIMALGLVACAPSDPLLGSWTLASGDGGVYGDTVAFDKDGNFTYAAQGITIEGLDQGSEAYINATETFSSFSNATYVKKDDATLTITVVEMFGINVTNTDVAYSVDGNTLVLGDSTYQRSK